ncbi:MAG: hypothetical protein QG657_3855 [Acidobacteriota bacterium]|nr:hypothetical protein [Acidobacteriota bacterium]
MAVETPKIERRTFEDYFKEFKALIPFYTPEWRLEEKEKNADLAIVKIFIQLLTFISQQLNRLPEKHFISFLDRIGIKLIPAQSASAPVVFVLSEGATEHILIPARTQVASGDVIFETEKNVWASPARLVKVYSVDVKKDAIYQSPPHIVPGLSALPFETTLAYSTKTNDSDIFVLSSQGLAEGDHILIGKTNPEYAVVSAIADAQITLSHKLETTSFKSSEPVKKVTSYEPFKEKNLQEHVLYLGHTDLFNSQSAIILNIHFTPGGAGKTLEIPQTWQYYGVNKDTGLSDWYNLACVSTTGSGNKIVTLVKGNDDEIAEYEVNGITSRWIRCIEKSPANQMEVATIGIATPDTARDILPAMLFQDDVPLALTLANNSIDYAEKIYPFGKRPAAGNVFYIGSSEAFSKKNISVTLKFSSYRKNGVPSTPVAIELIDFFGLGDTFMDRLTDAGISTINQFLAHSVDDLMKILKTRQRRTVINIRRAIQKWYIEISRIEELGGEPEKPGELDDMTGAASAASTDSSQDLTLSWEYWDGKGWSCIENLVDGTGKFLINGNNTVTFVCPKDIEKTDVAGQNNYWIRVRITYGDYGKEKMVENTSTSPSTWEISTADIDPPVIYSLKIAYNYGAIPPTYCLAENNLGYTDYSNITQIEGNKFKPFTYLDDTYRAIYLGFNYKLEKGPISLLFIIDEKPVTPDQVPFIRWEYYNEELEWEKLTFLDATMGLTKTGVIEFVFPTDFLECRKFGTDAYWIRAVYEEKTASGADNVIIPIINGIYLNTAWAIQCETIKSEIPGSSDGSAGQQFTLTKVPVVSGSEEIWIDEFKSLSTEEQTRLTEEEIYEVEPVPDDKGEVTEFWVKWEPVDNLPNASADDRCYEIDNVSGTITFGDGVYGKIPPSGKDNIKVNYSSGGGEKGNLAELLIKDLKASVPFLEKAFNPLAAAGGAETETIDDLMERGPYLLRHRNRAVTREDFENLTSQASTGIARVKCLPNMNEFGQTKEGWVTMIVMPHTDEEQPVLSLQLKDIVLDYLDEHAPMIPVEKDHIRVTGPVYVEVTVYARIMAESIDDVPVVEQEAGSQLKDFLYPLTGGSDQKGWEFGKIPCFSDFYALLEKIEGVDYVADLSLKLTPQSNCPGFSETTLKPDSLEGIAVPPYIMVCSGKHEINVSISI